MSVDVTLHGARLPDGTVRDIHVVDGHVSDVPGGAADVVDLTGSLVLPALAEPHAHLDKAFLADRFPNPSGELLSAIDVILTGWPKVTADDIGIRARRAVHGLVMAGTTAVRTHADLNPESGMKSVDALIRVRDEMRPLVDIQVVALTTYLTGPDGPAARRLLDTAIEAGIDGVGSCPHLEEDPATTIDISLAAASGAGLFADLHLDEVLDVSVQNLESLASATERHGMGGRVTASHCVSHGLADPVEQRRVGRLLAQAGVSVVTNPRTNLFLQARGVEQGTPRAMAGIAALLDSGVTVAGGSDNVQDPFYVIGRTDPLETASLLVAAAHRTVDEAVAMVTDGARRLMGVPAPGFEPGDPADFVAIRAGSVREAVAEQPADRVVIRAGRVIARTTVDRWVTDA